MFMLYLGTTHVVAVPCFKLSLNNGLDESTSLLSGTSPLISLKQFVRGESCPDESMTVSRHPWPVKVPCGELLMPGGDNGSKFPYSYGSPLEQPMPYPI